MKRVSFKVAKAIKKAGYPQIFIECAYYEDNKLHHTEDPYNNCRTIIAYAPTYIEAWLWLWREKDMKLLFYPTYKEDSSYSYIQGLSIPFNKEEYNDPEEAIIAVIDYFIDNDLIK